jgi:hypothetical protein
VCADVGKGLIHEVERRRVHSLSSASGHHLNSPARSNDRTEKRSPKSEDDKSLSGQKKKQGCRAIGVADAQGLSSGCP